MSELDLVKTGIGAVKHGYKDEKEELTSKNLEILIISKNGVKLL